MEKRKKENLSIGWSAFALKRNKKGNHSKFRGTPEELIRIVKKNWDCRQPGVGRNDCTQVVVVPVGRSDLRKFSTPWSNVADAHHLRAKVVTRQEGEDPYIEVHGQGKRLKVKHAKVVLYSADTLLENGGERSTDCDWEIVAIMAGPWDNEPMSPLTMARNFLAKQGGTPVAYTAEQFAESIYFWSQFVKVK
jgi:hypothetical protein